LFLMKLNYEDLFDVKVDLLDVLVVVQLMDCS
jgi:hypothetical protein